MCLQAGCADYHTHFLSKCRFLPDSDKQFLTKCRHIAGSDVNNLYVDSETFGPVYEESNAPNLECTYDHMDVECKQNHVATDCKQSHVCTTAARRVNVKQSPFLHAFFEHHPLRLTIDTGAETNMIRASVAKYIGAKIAKSSQLALQADGQTPTCMSIIGETNLMLSRNVLL